MAKQSITRTVLINIGIFLGFLILIDILIISGWESRRFVNYLRDQYRSDNEERVDKRTLLPNYENKSWAREYFADFNKLKDNNYKSYIGWRKTAFKSRYINLDSFGIRFTPQPKLRKDSILEITFLGGSTMWGTGSPDSATIPAFFAKEGNGTYVVENFGESGYRAMQSYIYLLLRMNKGLKSDWIISYDGVNEAVGFLEQNDPNSTYAEYRMRQKLLEKKDLSKIVTDLTFKHYFLDPVLNTVDRFKRKKIIKPKMNVILTDKRTDQVARTLLDSWYQMRELAEDNGANFLAVLQPNAALGSPNISHLEFDEYEALLMTTYSALYNRVKELIKNDQKYTNLRGNILDLTNCYDGEEIFYIDWCHVSPNGNEVVAKRINERIKKNLEN